MGEQGPKEVDWSKFKDVNKPVLDLFRKSFASTPSASAAPPVFMLKYACMQACPTRYCVPYSFSLRSCHLRACRSQDPKVRSQRADQAGGSRVWATAEECI